MLCGVASTACGPDKEAQDPREILGEDLTHRGVDGTKGVQRGDEPPGGKPQKRDPPATLVECRAAHTQLARLGIREEVAKTTDDAAQRARLEGELLEDEHVQRDIERAAHDCASDGMTRSIVLCMARAQTGRDVERCIE